MIYVELFGNFKMYAFENEEKKSVRFPAKSGCVLAYILLNRDRAITKEEFLDTFWSNPSSSNPVNAFKGLLFRIRRELTSCLGEAEYIIEDNGCYRWNHEIEVEIDVEVFSHLIARLNSRDLSNSQKISICESVLKLYKGDFLSNVHNLYWADLTSGYYRSLNIKTIIQLIGYYKKEKEYKKIENLCVDTLKSNYMDEDIYYYLILAKIFLNKRQEARDTYNEAIAVLKNEMGVEHLEKLESLKEKIIHLKNYEAKKIETICDEIEAQELNGTFLCQYTVFCEICRLEYRKMLREEYKDPQHMLSRHILLMKVQEKNQKDDMLENVVREEVMDRIEKIIANNLRSGDVISRCSGDQFIFLLLGCTIDNCMMISQRIVDEIERKRMGVRCQLQYQRLTSGNPIKKK